MRADVCNASVLFAGAALLHAHSGQVAPANRQQPASVSAYAAHTHAVAALVCTMIFGVHLRVHTRATRHARLRNCPLSQHKCNSQSSSPNLDETPVRSEHSLYCCVCRINTTSLPPRVGLDKAMTSIKELQPRRIWTCYATTSGLQLRTRPKEMSHQHEACSYSLAPRKNIQTQPSQKKGGSMIHRLGYFSRPSLPSNVCTSRPWTCQHCCRVC